MTGANGGTDPDARQEWRWDVALSFAGAQRDYVEQVAQVLKARAVRCFYDADEQIELWGRPLGEVLPAVYGEQAAVVVMFVSAEYAARDWTRHERRAALARAVRERREYVLPARFDETPLPGLMPDVSYVDLRRWTPQQFAAMIVAKLAALGITAAVSSADEEGPIWDVEAARPAGAVRMAEADLRRLGVHAAISVSGMPDDVPPEYVPRDADEAEFGIRARVAAAADRGGFVLLVGGSSVGKTRCAAEAVKALLPDWWLVHPADPAEVAVLAQAPTPRMVVWLDELQRYLDGEHGLTGGMVRALLNAPGPVVIIGTLWPDRYAAYTTLPAPRDADPHDREREVLDLAAVIRIGAALSPAENGRARAAAARDPRLALALGAVGYGLTQTLAAAPQLVARWQDAPDANPYAWAVLTAALDAARLGARTPLSPGLLRAAAPGYCTAQQQAEAPGNWFEQALAYATARLHGAAAALAPAGTGMSQVAGYIVADYLLQHASHERRATRPPASSWDALLLHIRDPADLERLADSAMGRLLYRYAIPFYRHAADAGDRSAAERLARLLAECGDLDQLRTRADAGDHHAAERLAWPLAERGDLDEAVQILRGPADVGHWDVARNLAEHLAMLGGDPDGAIQVLRAPADAGDRSAAGMLAQLLAERGDLDEAIQILRALADAGEQYAPNQLARALAERGDLDEAIQILRALADAGDQYAACHLALLLKERGDPDGAIRVLRAPADAGGRAAAGRLAEMLAEHGDLDGLRARADAGDWHAAERLAGLLDERGDPDGAIQILRAQADAGDQDAAYKLAKILAEHGDLDGLRARADAGDQYAVYRLADLLDERGDLDGAIQILRALADADDQDAAYKLAEMLAERGDLDGLRAQADAGDWHAAVRLAGLLAERGDLDGLRARADAGDRDATERLAGLLEERGDPDGAIQVLRAPADADNRYAAGRLARLLAERGDLDGLRARADAGDQDAAYRLARLLAERGDLDGLRARTDAGDQDAAQQLTRLMVDLLVEQGLSKEAEQLRRFGLNPDGSIACT